MPEEIIYAADMLPFRVTGGSADIIKADAYLYANICSYSRSCFELALKNDYDLLDGLVTGNICDHVRRLFDVWEYYIKTPFLHILNVPHKISDSAYAFFKKEVKEFKENLEKFSEAEISDESLYHAIDVYNKSRILLKRLYNLRKEVSPPISGAETLNIVKAGMMMPKDRYNQFLEGLLEEIRNRDRFYGGKARLLISGCDLHDSNYIKLIEDLEGLVVADDLCTGSRYFWELVDTTVKPLDGIVKRYLSPILCARMHPSEERLDHILKMIKMFDVDGVIYEVIKFCDIYGCEYPNFKERLKEWDIPVLMLDREHVLSGIGQMKTKVQAFIESIGGEI